MECVRASFERLAVRGEAGLAIDESATASSFTGGTYDSALIKLTAKLEASLLLLNNHVALEEFTVDVVVVKEDQEEEEEARGSGVLGFLHDAIVGSRTPRAKNNVNNNVKTRSEEALTAAWEACRARGYHSLYAMARITADTLPHTACREHYTAGHYAEALLNGCRAHFMFQRHHPLFNADALTLWTEGGAGCVAAVGACHLVLAWRLDERETANKVSPLMLFNTTATAAAAATYPKQGRKRGAVAQSEESFITHASKRTKVAPITPPHPSKAASREEEQEEEEEEEEVTFKEPLKDKIPEVWYSPDITLPTQRSPAARQAPTPPSPPRQKTPGRPGRRPANQTHAPASPVSHTQPSTLSPAAQPSPPPQVTQEPEDDLSDFTFGFERSTPRGRGRGRGRGRPSTATTPRKSMLLPQWSDEEKEELLGFFDTLNPSQTEQTCIALTCKFATMRFGRELPSKQLYQWVQQKNRHIHPRPEEYILPGGNAGVHAAAAELFRSLNQDVSESKRVDFTCRFMKTQYGAELSSKELFNILSGGGRRGRGRGGRGR